MATTGEASAKEADTPMGDNPGEDLLGALEETSQGPTNRELQSQLTALTTQFQAVLSRFNSLTTSRAEPIASQPTTPAQQAPTQAPSATDLNTLTTKKLAKKSLNLAKKQKLLKPNNY